MDKGGNKGTAALTWQDIQEEMANDSGMAVVMVEGRNSSVISASNNNSICETLQASKEFAHLCQRYCGQAYSQGLREGKPACIRCHAGLTYATVPVEVEGKKLVAIVGRTFNKSSDYREATEKARSGDWKDLPAEKLLDNVLMSSSLKELEKVARRLQDLSKEEKQALAETENEFRAKNPVRGISLKILGKSESGDITPARKSTETISITTDIQLPPPERQEKKPARQISEMVKQFHHEEKIREEKVDALQAPQTQAARKHEELDEVAAWRSLFNSLLEMNYHQGCVSVLKFLAVKYKFQALAWLERKDDRLETYLAGGTFKGQQLRINLPVKDPRLTEAINQESALELLEKSGTGSAKNAKISLFPLVVGGEMRSALVVGDEIVEDDKRRGLARFCRQVAVSMEILRLREEIERQSWLNRAIKKFNEGLTKLEPEDFWPFLAQASAELLQSELGSLLIFDEENTLLKAEASVGKDVNVLNSVRQDVGKRVAERVLENGRPLVVTDVVNTGLPPAPLERKYKTRSFLSYPIVFGKQKIGVLNMTDKVDGSVYDDYDLELLNAVTPQLAVAFDRAKLERKAGKFEQLSITDPLTGLLNRRYLEERLAEEINRSRRHGYPMSFLMIDVDEFKSYNDTYLHTAGDKVLQLLAHCLKDCLRGADVAARYGGEEFSILLPQTSLAEAKTIAERIREKVESTDFPNRRITISMGVAAFAPSIKTPEELISAADTALYQAKSKGRNNVQVYKSLPATTTLIGDVSEGT